MALHLEKQPLAMSELPPFPKHSSRTLETNSKGKAKIQDIDMDDSQSTCCGICLHEETRAIRGAIDSCDHFFCFVCIMEWSKVESRCPMCKRRFSSITRPPLHGAFHSQRIFNIPTRDQVENEVDDSTMELPGQYSDAKCSVCNGTQAENLLLLCDLCDSAAHSFCVELGSTVPEENWFCHECTILKDEHARNESPNEQKATLFEIVHDPDLDPCSIKLPEFRKAQRVSSTKLVPKTVLAESIDAASRIDNLRQNWNAIQTGSMSFNSNSVKIPKTSNRKLKVVCDSRAKDIEKAWKMLNAAKRITKGVVCSASKPYAREVNNVVKEASVSTMLTASNNKKRVAVDPMLGKLDNKNKAIQVCNSRENVWEPLKKNITGETSNHVHGQPKKCKTEKSCSDESAKREIISLVKLNLKLLSRDIKLEVGLFKEVARLSTHSILAACGLESPTKRGVRSFISERVCRHVDKDDEMRKSSLMRGCCRDCFMGFVKDVVNRIVIEKVG